MRRKRRQIKTRMENLRPEIDLKITLVYEDKSKKWIGAGNSIDVGIEVAL